MAVTNALIWTVVQHFTDKCHREYVFTRSGGSVATATAQIAPCAQLLSQNFISSIDS